MPGASRSVKPCVLIQIDAFDYIYDIYIYARCDPLGARACVYVAARFLTRGNNGESSPLSRDFDCAINLASTFSSLVAPINILASDDVAAKYRSLHYG